MSNDNNDTKGPVSTDSARKSNKEERPRFFKRTGASFWFTFLLLAAGQLSGGLEVLHDHYTVIPVLEGELVRQDKQVENLEKTIEVLATTSNKKGKEVDIENPSDEQAKYCICNPKNRKLVQHAFLLCESERGICDKEASKKCAAEHPDFDC